MRKVALVALLALTVLTLSGKSLQITQEKSDGLEIRFSLPAFETTLKQQDGVLLKGIKLTGETEEEWSENFSGYPQLQSWVYIPDGFEAVVSISNENVKTGGTGDYAKLETPEQGIEWLDASSVLNMRGNRILSLCVKPFSYDSDERKLEVLQEADIRVDFVPNPSLQSTSSRLTPATASLLQSLCLNRNSIRTDNLNPGSYVILYNGTTLQSIIQPYADWKHEKGYRVTMTDTATLGTTNSVIKAYLQNAYDTWEYPPEFILIIGDVSGSSNIVPTYTESYEYNTVGDYRYTLLEGNDIIPDAFIGRLPFSSTDELQTMLNRLLNYEKMQNLSTTNWLNKSFLLADISDSGESCLTTIKYVKDLISGYNSNILFTEAYAGSFPSQINAALNSGVGTYWYRGHGDFSGWTTTDINNLNNAGKYFFFSYITCFTANFAATSMSQAERLIRLGTPNLPKGAIGVIGASCETHTCLNNIVTAGIAYGLYVEGMTQGGPALLRGKLALQANYPQNPANYINQYFQSINLLGDPGLDIWLQQAADVIVTAPSSISAAGGVMSVRVTYTNGSPVAGAWVCLSKSNNELFANGYTNADGWIVLSYNASSAGTAKLTITKANCRTFQSVLTINGGSPITMQNIADLQVCAAGSEPDFSITLTNNGTAALTEVYGTLEALDSYVSVISDSVYWGDLAPGNPVASLSDFQIAVSSHTPKGSVLHLNLHLMSSAGSFDLPFSCTENGPDLHLESATFSNNLLAYGNNTLSISLKNEGSLNATGIQSLLQSSHPWVVVQNPSQMIGNITADSTVTIPGDYTIAVSDSLLEGVKVKFNLELYNQSGFVQVIQFEKSIGSPTTNDVTGPDAYGYICYGPGDAGYVPYNWIELDPTQGGSGNYINISDTNIDGGGVTFLVTLPFQFRFYGRSYSQISVCSNGFIMPGAQSSIEWMNWQIPGPLVPRPIIAPFWDDLLTDTSSRLMYKYDSNLNAEIIQWQNMKNRYSPSLRETFQVILYDPVHHSSPTGDSPILFQYKVFNNVDAGNYGVDHIDHGQYASIGIGDHTGQVGLSYSFNNQYPITAQSLSHLSTLYFTSLPTYQLSPQPVILNCQTTELTGNGNNQVDAGEELSLSFIIKNIGLGTIAESQVSLSSTDPYITLINDTSAIQSLTTNQVQTTSPAFTVQISQDCPNQHGIDLILNIHNQLEQFTVTYELIVNALQMNCTNFSYTDDNNHFAEPGETGQLSFSLSNLSLLDAGNINISILPIDGITAIPQLQSVSVLSLSSIPVVFNLSIGSNLPQGSYLQLPVALSVPGIYDTLFTYSLLIGIPEVFLDTDFDDNDLSGAFQFVYNVGLTPAFYIHDSGNEVSFAFNQQNPWSYAFCYPVNTLDLMAIQINFKWFSSYQDANLSLMAMYPNQQSLDGVWSTHIATVNPQSASVILNEFPADAEYIILAFVADFTAATTGQMVIDDISILTVHHAPGYITGHVNLDLFPENVDQVQISHRYSNQIYHPDNSGNYLIPAYQGLNVIYASLPGYICNVDSLAVYVISNQTVSDNDFSFQRLCAPYNLTYSLNENLLTLNWQLEGSDSLTNSSDQTDKNSRFLLPDYYRIWIRCNNFNFQDTSPVQSYSRILNMVGEYQIYVCSVFLLDGIEETWSNQSNVINFNYTSVDEDISGPLVLSLLQNRPNPFNPETTISFTITEKNPVVLNVYNLKGQRVKSLCNENLNPGVHSIIWNGTDDNGIKVTSGIYYYKLVTQGKELIRKMVMLK